MPRKKAPDNSKPLPVEQARAKVAKAMRDVVAGNDPGPITFRLKRTKKADETYPLRLARNFAAVPHRVLFVGHLHRWLLGTPDGLLPWRGEGPVRLDDRTRHLVVVHAVSDGWCALFDTTTGELTPFGGL